MRVTQATKMDISLVEDVLRRNHLPYKDIASKIGALFIWRTNQDIIGIGGLELYDRVGLLRSLVIEERFRGKGSGKKLCSELVGLAKLKGVLEIYLLTTTAEGFFRRNGFERIERNIVPEVIKQTTEFTSLCPSSAVCMKMETNRQAPLLHSAH
jgi:amino-acid N-acetyltransferase